MFGPLKSAFRQAADEVGSLLKRNTWLPRFMKVRCVPCLRSGAHVCRVPQVWVAHVSKPGRLERLGKAFAALGFNTDPTLVSIDKQATAANCFVVRTRMQLAAGTTSGVLTAARRARTG